MISPWLSATPTVLFASCKSVANFSRGNNLADGNLKMSGSASRCNCWTSTVKHSMASASSIVAARTVIIDIAPSHAASNQTNKRVPFPTSRQLYHAVSSVLIGQARRLFGDGRIIHASTAASHQPPRVALRWRKSGRHHEVSKLYALPQLIGIDSDRRERAGRLAVLECAACGLTRGFGCLSAMA